MMFLSSSKKAQTETQFHWVFVLIAGAIILAFFVSLTVWYKGQQETKLEGTLATRLAGLFAAAQESPRTAKPLQLPEYRLTFTCDTDACTDYSCASAFSSGGISQPTETDVVFTRRSLQGTQLVTWALPWEVPFPVMNFLYLTNDRQRFVLVYDESDDAGKKLALVVNEVLQQNAYLNKQLVALSEISSLENYNDDHVRVVSFGGSSGELAATLASIYEDDPYDLVFVVGDSVAGIVQFSSSSSISYLGMPLLLGAIFSDDVEIYTCNLQKALFRFDLMLAQHQQLVAAYSETLAPTEQAYCIPLFEQINARFTSLAHAHDSLATGDVPSEGVSALSELGDVNRQLLMQNCPRLY